MCYLYNKPPPTHTTSSLTSIHRIIKAEAMEKQNSNLFLIFLFVLPLVLSTSARPLVQKLDQETRAYEINPRERDMEHLINLMGSEECGDKDEGCLERRMIAEAHLDYIYTQHHKP